MALQGPVRQVETQPKKATTSEAAPQAAVTALTPCTVFELRKVDVAPLLAAQPEIAHAFEVAVGRGQTMMERAVAASVGAATMPPGALLDRIRAFLRFDG